MNKRLILKEKKHIEHNEYEKKELKYFKAQQCFVLFCLPFIFK